MSRAPSRAFTLVEVIVTVALVAVLSGGMLAFVVQVNARQRALSAESERARGVSAFFEAFDNDLSTTAAYDPAHGPGLRGDDARVRVLSRGLGLEAGSLDATGRTRVREFYCSGGVLYIGETPAAEKIARVRFRYHDGESWKSSFNSSQSGGLAAAVEVAVWHERDGASSRLAADPDDDEALVVPEREPPPDRVRVFAVLDGPGARQRGDR